MRYTKAKEVALLGVLFRAGHGPFVYGIGADAAFGAAPGNEAGAFQCGGHVCAAVFAAQAGTAAHCFKAVFALLTRGVTAGFLSLCGGGASFAVLCLLLAWPRPVTGFIFSVCGALAHIIGQLCGAAVLLSDHMALAYAPVLLCAGTVVGSLTWAVSRAVFPALRRVWKSEEKRERNIIFKM